MRFRLLPTDDRFFDLFNDSAKNAADCAVRLREVLSGPDDLEAGFERVRACEHKGDEITKSILQRLNTSFVTPFDREDIHELAEELDDVVDDIQSVCHRLQLTGVPDGLIELRDQADVLVEMAAVTVELVKLLASMKGVQPHLDAIDRLESEGDAVYRKALAHLFSGEFEALDVIKWKDTVEAMEHALNKVEDVSNVIEAIVFKHA